MSRKRNKEVERSQKKVERRPDLEDPARGKDLSYLNEFPQFSVDEGVKAGVPPPKDKSTTGGEREN
jgi:hypothetical protein